MRLRDMLATSQNNLLRSKLRTFLTISAIFIGTFTISLTNGVGNGLKSYIDRELGSIGAGDTLVVQPRVAFDNPVSSGVQEYDPERQTGMFNTTLLGQNDIAQLRTIKGVTKVTPEIMLQIEYVGVGDKKFQASTGQYVEGLKIHLASGSIFDVNSTDSTLIPKRYVQPLGFSSPEDAVGKTVMMGYKDASGKIVEKSLKVAGVMEQSLLGNASFFITDPLTEQIHEEQTKGVVRLANAYTGLRVKYDSTFTEEEVEALKQLINANGYTAQTIQDAIGTINTVINGILIVFNVFGAIALIAATFGIVNTLFMAVTERTSEIGLMKALGANRLTIFSIFALEAASIGFWGAFLGIGVTVAAAPLINNFATNNFLQDFVGFDLLVFPILPSLGIMSGIILLAFLAGTLPSMKASKLDPISALRYE